MINVCRSMFYSMVVERYWAPVGQCQLPLYLRSGCGIVYPTTSGNEGYLYVPHMLGMVGDILFISGHAMELSMMS